MRFLDPWYGVLLIPIVVGLWYSWRYVHGMAVGRKRAAFVLRALMAGLIVVALMGPQSRQNNQGLTTMFLLDGSDSISDNDLKEAEGFISAAMQKLGTSDLGGVIVFGRQPVMESSPSGRRAYGRVTAQVDRSASDLAAAVRLAGATFPEGKGRRIVVLSDANETMGDVLQAVEAAAMDDVQIDMVRLGVKQDRAEAAVLSLEGPTERRQDEPFDLKVVLESTQAQSGVLVLDRDGLVVSRTRVQIPVGRSTIILPQKLDATGFYRYKVTLEPTSDRDVRNNVGASFVAVKGKPKILVLQSDPSKRELADALRSQGLEVQLSGPEGLPARPEDAQIYDSIILSDLSADQVTDPQMRILKSAVRDTGVGFGMVGGENSFLPGGWYGTPVAEALPVDLNIRQRRSFPSTSVLIMVDASGSMAMIENGQPKIRLAAKAAEQVANLMSDRDRIGVAGSSSGIEFVAPMQDLKDKSKVIEQIRTLNSGGGGIYAEPTITRAEEELDRENSKVRHFILVADAADTDQYGDSLMKISRMRANKITTSVVAIGRNTDKDIQFLKAVAAAGGGGFYLANEASKLPAIFTRDVAMIGRSAIEEFPFTPLALGGEEILGGINSLPMLRGYCIVEPRSLARVGMKSPKDDTLLAIWQFGLGQSLAFTSDAQNKWARDWMGSSVFGRFWAQAARAIGRQSTDNRYVVETRTEGGKALVSVTAKDALGQPLTKGLEKVLVSQPDGTSQELTLIQEAAGVYTGSLPARQMGSYIVSVAEQNAIGQSKVSTSGFAVSYPPEYKAYRTNDDLAKQLVQAGRGKIIVKPEEAVRKLERPGMAIQDLWMWFVLAALAMLPLDIAIRRLVIPWGEMFGFLKSLSPQKTAEAQPTERLERLQKSKSSPAASTPAPDVKVEPVRRAAEPKKGPEPARGKTGATASQLLEAKRKRKSGD